MERTEQEMRNLRLKNQTQNIENKIAIVRYLDENKNHFVYADFDKKTLELPMPVEVDWDRIYDNGIIALLPDRYGENAVSFIIGVAVKRNKYYAYYVNDGDTDVRKCGLDAISPYNYPKITNMILNGGETIKGL